jgi:hypothetical protein
MEPLPFIVAAWVSTYAGAVLLNTVEWLAVLLAVLLASLLVEWLAVSLAEWQVAEPAA